MWSFWKNLKFMFKMFFSDTPDTNKMKVPKKYRFKDIIGRILTLGFASFRSDAYYAYSQRIARQQERLPVKIIFVTAKVDPFDYVEFDFFEKRDYPKTNKENGKYFGIGGGGLSCHGLHGYKFYHGTEIKGIEALNAGEFVIVKTDPTYYEYDILPFSYKIREYITSVDKTYDAESIVDLLKHNEDLDEYCIVWLSKYANRVRKAYAYAREKYPEDDLSLTVIYPDGDAHFEFCRTMDIKYTLNKGSKEFFDEYDNLKEYDEDE